MTHPNTIVLHRLHRLSTLGVVMFMVLLLSCTFTGWAIYNEITTTYVENYNILANAGFGNLVTAPQVVSERILILVSLMPLIGAGLIFPILFKVACEIRLLSQEKLNPTPTGDDLKHVD